ncbi:hypothetical protein BGZ99_001522 [Dissophora globulifera]|uniref:Uncharacterized protein n=1 Tax=Dissophora globulifera TaxID=979702 RepID=A0A9P6QZM6_9FUNG|nr:hypothetical protein BGZ99_001522 [Dissophora globulifera]
MPSHHIRTLFKGHDAADMAPTPAADSGPRDTPDTPSSVEILSSQGKASEHMLSTPGSRKRSILFNMILPPEAPPVDAGLALPPHIPLPPMIDSTETIVDREITATEIKSSSLHATSTSTSTSRSLRSWILGDGDDHDHGAQVTKRHGNNRTEGDHHEREQEKGSIVKGQSQSVVSLQTTTVVSKSTTIKTWFSKKSHVEVQKKEGSAHHGSENASKDSESMTQTTSTLQQQQHAVQSTNGRTVVATTVQQEVVHQETHQKTRTVALVNVNVSVHDVLGLGKVMEITLAMFHAHGAFLRRQPFWLQCVMMGWEALVVLLVVWGLLRIVGLAEVIVWGADDLVRGALATVRVVGTTLQAYLSY